MDKLRSKTINVILIRPPFLKTNMAIPAEPLGIAYIASYLRQNMPHLNIRILDAHIEDLSEDSILGLLKDANIVGLSYLTPQADFSYQLSLRIKKTFPEIILVHGGVHPTCVWEEAIQYADYCILGEGEVSFYEFIKALQEKSDLKRVAGLCFKEDGQIIRTNPRDFISDIDIIPFPARDLLNIERYRAHSIHIRPGQAIGIIASRGCPFHCSFCASPIFWKKNVRFRSPENIIEEIKEVISKFGINQFHFYDDNFLLSQEFVMDLCELILKEQLNIFWVCLGRISLIKNYPEILKLMHRAGCVAMELGIESFDNNILAQIGKQEKTDDIPEFFNLIRENNIKPLMLLMTFNPGETISGWYLQAQGLRQVEPEASLFLGQFATPYPKTDFDNNCNHLGIKLAKQWKDYSTSQINFIPYSLLKDIPQKTSKYFDPRYLARIIYTTLNHGDIWSRLSLFEKIKNAFILSSLIYSFYFLCKGDSTIEKIADIIAKDYEIDFRLSLKAIAYLGVLMAQLGLLCSHYSNVAVIPYKKVFAKFGYKKFIYIGLSYFLFIFTLILQKIIKGSSRDSAKLIANLFDTSQ